MWFLLKNFLNQNDFDPLILILIYFKTLRFGVGKPIIYFIYLTLSRIIYPTQNILSQLQFRVNFPQSYILVCIYDLAIFSLQLF